MELATSMDKWRLKKPYKKLNPTLGGKGTQNCMVENIIFFILKNTINTHSSLLGIELGTSQVVDSPSLIDL